MLKILKGSKYPSVNSHINYLTVGIAEYKVSRNPRILVTYALGSCIAVILHDPYRKIGAMVHAMLPEPKTPRIDNPIKYVSTSIPIILRELKRYGCNLKVLESAIIGGAHILKLPKSINIGSKNVEIARKILKEYNIRIVEEDVGGNYSRTVFYELATGKIYVYIPKTKLSLLS